MSDKTIYTLKVKANPKVISIWDLIVSKRLRDLKDNSHQTKIKEHKLKVNNGH
jgi:hypothetical protein